MVGNRRWAASLVVLAVFVAAIGFSGYRSNSRVLKRSFTADPRVTDSSLAAFRWLHQHTGANDVIVNDENADGSLWMYAFQGLHPLFGVEPIFSNPAAKTDWNDRLYLLNHLGELGGNHRADTLLQHFQARWVYFDKSVFDLFHHQLNLQSLLSDSNMQLAFQRGSVYVFRISTIA